MNPTRRLTIVAQDPQLRALRGSRKCILTAQVSIPNEFLDSGPRGSRVFVIDYDASSGILYEPLDGHEYGTVAEPRDPYQYVSDHTILHDPRFHAQNVYALVMRTLARFEFALGRRVSWGFGGHQLFIAPHAFGIANAFYTREDHALLFGYFPVLELRKRRNVFSCLSHDVVVHETTHALLDGLRVRYQDPSSPDQAAFHEGFADIVAILSAFSLPEVMRAVFPNKSVRRALLTRKALQTGVLLSLAEEMGTSLGGFRGNALRQSATITPSPALLRQPRYLEEHERGEIFVAAILHALLDVLELGFERLGDRLPNGRPGKGPLDRERIIIEAAETAERLLNIVIRAIDYTPPVHLTFNDFLSAVLTADTQIVPDDSRYQFRQALVKNFAAFGIEPASAGVAGGVWEPPTAQQGRELDYDSVHLEGLQTDPEEIFRFLWANRARLGMDEHSYTRVISVRPARRHGPDGFVLHETVAEYMQQRTLLARELRRVGITKPAGMDEETEVTIYGGGTLIFDEYGRLKFHIRNRIDAAERQTARLEHLFASGYFSKAGRKGLAALHLDRMATWPLGVRCQDKETI